MQGRYTIEDYLRIIRSGLEKGHPGGRRKKVIIIGAGMAGLVAGYELKRAGHQPVIEEIIRPEGRIHFAGEHASLYHAWIQGAIESGLREASAIHQIP